MNAIRRILSQGLGGMLLLGAVVQAAEDPLKGDSAVLAPGATWMIETYAGNGAAGDLPAGGGAARGVPVDLPFGVEAGPDGAIYVTSIGQHRVLRVDPKQQLVTCVAGSGVMGHAGDGGPATEAQLNEPYEVRFDSRGNMIFVEMKNHLLRRVDLHGGVISTIAGDPQPGFAGDGGPARAARFNQPHSIALDADDHLYVADIANHRIRKIDARSGQITSIAGDGEKALPRDGGLAQGHSILGPRALSIVGDTMWIALREGNSIWRLDLKSGRIHHVAGTGKAGYSGDGAAPALATFNGPKGIVATAEGVVYVVDSENQAIRRIDVRGNRIDTIAGGGPRARGFAGEGTAALQAQLDRPHGIGLAPQGGVLIGDTNNHRVRWVHPAP